MGIEAVDTGVVETFANDGFYDDVQKAQWNGREVKRSSSTHGSALVDQKMHATMAQHASYNNAKTSSPQPILCGKKADIEVYAGGKADSDGNAHAEGSVGVISKDDRYSASVNGSVGKDSEGNVEGSVGANATVQSEDRNTKASVEANVTMDNQGNTKTEVTGKVRHRF